MADHSFILLAQSYGDGSSPISSSQLSFSPALATWTLIAFVALAGVAVILTCAMAGSRLSRTVRIAGLCVVGGGVLLVMFMPIAVYTTSTEWNHEAELASRQISVEYQSEATANTHSGPVPEPSSLGIGLLLLVPVIVTYVMAGPRLRRGLRIAGLCVVGCGGAIVLLYIPYFFLNVNTVVMTTEDFPEYRAKHGSGSATTSGHGESDSSHLTVAARSEPDEAAASSIEDQESESDTPDDAPRWVRQSPQQTAQVHRRVIEVGPYSTDLECRQFMDEKLVEAADSYLDERVLHGDHRLMTISSAFMRKHVVADEYMKTEKRSFGPLADDQSMYTLYHLLEFDEAVYAKLTERARQATMQSRLTYAGFGLASLMALLTSAFGYLRLDAATEGKYKRSLQWGVGGVVATIAAGGWLLSQLVVLG